MIRVYYEYINRMVTPSSAAHLKPRTKLREGVDCGSPLPLSSAMSATSSKSRCHRPPRSASATTRHSRPPEHPDTSRRTRQTTTHFILQLQRQLRSPFLTADLSRFGVYRSKRRQRPAALKALAEIRALCEGIFQPPIGSRGATSPTRARKVPFSPRIGEREIRIAYRIFECQACITRGA